MKAPRRWRVKALHQAPCELFFPAGIDRDSIQRLYKGCHVEPIAVATGENPRIKNDRAEHGGGHRQEHGDDDGEGGEYETA